MGKKRNENINIVYISDNRYAPLLGISITSILEKNIGDSIRFFIIDDGIDNVNKTKIMQTIEEKGSAVHFVNPFELKLEKSQKQKWPQNVYYRLFLPTILKEYLLDERVIYIDCDTIILGDLNDLNKCYLGENICGAVMECMDKRHKKNCRINCKDPYYNSGVLLIDLDKWRKSGIEEKIRELIKKNANNRLEYPDEEIMNYALNNMISTLPPRYNLTTIKSAFSYEELKIYRKPSIMYSKEEYEIAISDPCIIHFTNNFYIMRPWKCGNGEVHPFSNAFLTIKQKSQWKDYFCENTSCSLLKYLLIKLIYFNRKLGIEMAGIIYAYLKPFKFNMIDI